MKATTFISLKSIQGITNHANFHRKKGKYCVPGVYFWGFTLRKDCGLPTVKEEMIIYYIGKSKSNVSERIMQEITQLIFGGFGTIIDKIWLINNYNKARLKNEQYNKTSNVLYTPDGLHMLYNFLTDKRIADTVEWMKERLIFTWIECNSDKVKSLEKEIHSIVRTNVLGVGLLKNINHPNGSLGIKEDSLFNKEIDWKLNPILKDWLIEVHENI